MTKLFYMTNLPNSVTIRSLEGGFSRGISFGTAVKAFHLHQTFINVFSDQFLFSIADGGINRGFLPLMAVILEDIYWDRNNQFKNMEIIYFRRLPPGWKGDKIMTVKGPKRFTLKMFGRTAFFLL